MEHRRTYSARTLYAILSLNLVLLLWQSVTFYLLYQRGLLLTNSRFVQVSNTVTPCNSPIQLLDGHMVLAPLPPDHVSCAVGH